MTNRKKKLTEISGVSFSDYFESVKSLGEVDVEKVDKIINQVTEQSSYWQIQWLFSAANSPNQNAKKEWDAYEILFKELIQTQENSAPGTIDNYKEFKKLIEIKFVAEWNIDFYKDRGTKRRILDCYGVLGQFVHKLGLKGFGVWLTNRQLFPDWSVGRHINK